MRLKNHGHIERKPVEDDSKDEMKQIAAAFFQQPRQHALPKMPRKTGQKIENRLHHCAAETEEGTRPEQRGVKKCLFRAAAGKRVDDTGIDEADDVARHDDVHQIPALFFKAQTVPVVETYSTP